MRWVTSNDLSQWATRRDSQDNLPVLIRKLIYASIPLDSINQIRFRSHEDISRPGWDGILETSIGSTFIPQGCSVWEFSSDQNVVIKANKDYIKRTENPLGLNPNDTTYVFCTPRSFNKDKWVREKNSEGKWKKILAYDATDLEHWCERSPSVAYWFASDILDKVPSINIQDCESFWKEWSVGPKGIKLHEKLLLGNRDKERQRLIDDFLNERRSEVVATTRDEAIAFIISAFLCETELREAFLSHALIITDLNEWERLIKSEHPYILIPAFDNLGNSHFAIENGHRILIPYGRETSSNTNKEIVLPRIKKETAQSLLVQSGVKEKEAKRVANNSAGNITIARRLLGFDERSKFYIDIQAVRMFLPALFANTWDSHNEGDREIVAQLSGKSYEDFEILISPLLNSSEIPILKIGGIWKVASPYDAWNYTLKYVSESDLKTFLNCLENVIGELDPTLKLPLEQRWMGNFLGAKRSYSSNLRQGMLKSLVLIRVLSTTFNGIPLNSEKIERYIDSFVRKILTDKDVSFWISIRDVTTYFAEASPEEFLQSIEKKISLEDTDFYELLNQKEDGFNTINYQVNLLWALEALAWFPEYLLRVSVILLKLHAKDPGGKSSNRPLRTLNTIFKLRLPRTYSSHSEISEILETLISKRYEYSWEFLYQLLPKFNQDHSFKTNHFLWRGYDREERIVTHDDLFRMRSWIIDLLLKHYDFTESRSSDLIQLATNIQISKEARDRIFEAVCLQINRVESIEFKVWTTLRDILHRHRSYPDAEWALPEEELKKFEELYHKVTPSDTFNQYIWLFQSQVVSDINGMNSSALGYETFSKSVLDKRLNGLTLIYNEYGLDFIINVSKEVKEPSILGFTLANVLSINREIEKIINLFCNNDYCLSFVGAFMGRISHIQGNHWVEVQYKNLEENGASETALADFCLCVNDKNHIWKFIEDRSSEVEKLYWTKINVNQLIYVNKDKEYAIDKLLQIGRYFSILNSLWLLDKNLETSYLVDVLVKAGTMESSESDYVDPHLICEVFLELDKRDDLDRAAMLRLEWTYHPILSSFNSHRKPKFLYRDFTSNIPLIIEMLVIAYHREDSPSDYEESIDYEDPIIQNKIRSASLFLDEWKFLSNFQSPEGLNIAELKKWILELRNQAKERSRLSITDSILGKGFGSILSANESWPPEEICELLEEINTKSLKEGFRDAIIYGRGLVTKFPDEGGNQERVLADKYRSYSVRIRNRYPVVSGILESIAKHYELDAKAEDDQADFIDLSY